jgi:hypothetical protein
MNSRIARTYIPDHYNDWWYQRWYNHGAVMATMYWSIKDQEIKFT